MKTDYTIIIIGSGPAGISTWLHLHLLDPKLADQTIILEKQKHPREKLCGGAILNHITQPIFNTLNITFDIPKLDINQIDIRYNDKQFSFKKESFMSIIDRSLFDAFLVKVARKRGAIICENEEYLQMHPEQDTLTIESSKNTYRTMFAVGADGALSKVREMIPQDESISYASTIETFSQVIPSIDTEYDSQSMIMDFSCYNQGIPGYLWHFPMLKNDKPFMNHGICNSNIIHNLSAKSMKKVFLKDLNKRQINLNDLSLKSHPVTYFKNNGILSNERVLLVGDAAGIEPLIGGGIHLSLSYGYIAAKTIIKSIHSKDVKEYTTTVANSYVGRYISNSIKMAKLAYSGKTEIMDTIKHIFAQL